MGLPPDKRRTSISTVSQVISLQQGMTTMTGFFSFAGLRCIAATVAAFVALAGSALAQDYPSQLIKMVVGYAPGGNVDFIARLVANSLSQHYGQSVVIINRPGAAGALGIREVRQAEPDGYTLLLAYTNEVILSPAVKGETVLDGFEPVAFMGHTPGVLSAGRSVEPNDFPGLLAAAKNGRRFTFGGGPNSPAHVTALWLNAQADFNFRFIPYGRGTSQIVNDVAGGHLDLFFGGLPASLSFIKAGTLKPLTLSGTERSEALPDIPTLQELGFESLTQWYVLLAPKGTPPEVVKKLRSDIYAILDTPTVRKEMTAQALKMDFMSGEALAAFLKSEKRKLEALTVKLGLKANQSER